jgi:hypothetical protein
VAERGIDVTDPEAMRALGREYGERCELVEVVEPPPQPLPAIVVPHTHPQFPADPSAERCHGRRKPRAGMRAKTRRLKVAAYRCNGCPGCWANRLRRIKTRLAATAEFASQHRMLAFAVSVTFGDHGALTGRIREAGGGGSVVRQPGGGGLVIAYVPATAAGLVDDLAARGEPLLTAADAIDRVRTAVDNTPTVVRKYANIVTHFGLARNVAKDDPQKAGDWIDFGYVAAIPKVRAAALGRGLPILSDDEDHAANKVIHSLTVQIPPDWTDQQVDDFVGEIREGADLILPDSSTSSVNSRPPGPRDLSEFDDGAWPVGRGTG